ncbi:hypothetical protein GCM10022221_13500 [Actinocorallia aurea]
MPVSLKDVLDALVPEEVDYAAAEALGPEALPHLALLAGGSNVPLAAKAVYLAGRIGADAAGAVVAGAAEAPDPRLRVAAAASLPWAPAEAAADLSGRLRADPDPGVRRHAAKALGREPRDHGADLNPP